MTNPLSKVVSITSARLLELGPSRSAASSAAGWLYRGGHARLRRGAAVDMVVSFSCYFQVQPKRTPVTPLRPSYVFLPPHITAVTR
jgi:hypothetical protein